MGRQITEGKYVTKDRTHEHSPARKHCCGVNVCPVLTNKPLLVQKTHWLINLLGTVIHTVGPK